MQMVCLKMDSSLCPAETIRFMQTGHQADSLDLCPSLDVPAKTKQVVSQLPFSRTLRVFVF